jgi:hypothetical protein
MKKMILVVLVSLFIRSTYAYAEECFLNDSFCYHQFSPAANDIFSFRGSVHADQLTVDGSGGGLHVTDSLQHRAMGYFPQEGVLWVVAGEGGDALNIFGPGGIAFAVRANKKGGSIVQMFGPTGKSVSLSVDREGTLNVTGNIRVNGAVISSQGGGSQ